MKPGLLTAALFAAMMFGVPAVAGAQGPRVAPSGAIPLAPSGAIPLVPSGAIPLARSRGTETDLRVPPLNFHELSRYAGWGGAIGAALGVAYGFAFEHGWDRKIMIVSDGVVGFTCGLVAGAAVYVVKAVRESR